MVKSYKVLRIIKLFFQQIILEMYKKISQGHGLFHVKDIVYNMVEVKLNIKGIIEIKSYFLFKTFLSIRKKDPINPL